VRGPIDGRWDWAVPAAIFGGFVYGSSPIELKMILLAILLVAMRAKFFIDDEA
jgi:hypothetical protein